MKPTQHSNIGINLLCYFFVITVLNIASSILGMGHKISIITYILGWIFSIGLLYAFFRLFNVRIASLESFYGNVPIGMHRLNNTPTSGETQLVEQEVHVPNYERSNPLNNPTETIKEPTEPFDWSALFSFKYLRYCGVFLMITAVLSIIFNIDWQLVHKIMLSASLGIIACIGAEIAHKKQKPVVSVSVSIVSFLLLQISLTMLQAYLQTKSITVLNQPWILIKLLLTLVYLLPLFRYANKDTREFSAVSYLFIAYISPWSMLWYQQSLFAWSTLVFMGGLTAIALLLTYKYKSYTLMFVNLVAMNVLTIILLNPNSPLFPLLFTDFTQAEKVIQLARIIQLSAFSAIFGVHLIAGSFIAMCDAKTQENAQTVHIVFLHIFIALGLFAVKQDLVFLNNYIGIAFLIAATCSLIAYMVIQTKNIQTQCVQVLLNSAIILGSIGILVQIKGPWSAIVFLGYACLVLWMSLYQQFLRTRIYGFIILTLSFGKLYLEFSDVFDSTPGSIAVLLIGLILFILSYKFESLKDVLVSGIHKEDE